MADPERVTVAAAADLLGVRRETVYAYISRGLLDRSHTVDANGHRASLLDLAQVQTLAERGRRTRAGSLELHLDTAITELDPEGRLLFRGIDATALATECSPERTAEILWQTGESGAWAPPDSLHEVVTHVHAVCPPGASPAARARIALGLLAARSAPHPADDPLTHAELVDAELAAAREAIVLGACALGPDGSGWQRDLAATVAHGLSESDPSPSTVDLVRRALVLLADHELATSTIAVRAAAGTGATMPLALLTGAAALGGPRHGTASRLALDLWTRWLDDRSAALPEIDRGAAGFGHKVYRGTDPRADHLLAELARDDPAVDHQIEALRLAVLQRTGLEPNVDLALAVLIQQHGLHPDAGEAIFLVGRLPGFAAHTLEERRQPLRFRPRAVYTGLSPHAPVE